MYICLSLCMKASFSVRCVYSGSTDRYEFSSKELGDIASICLGHIPKDGKKVKAEAFWTVDEVVVIEKELGNKSVS